MFSAFHMDPPARGRGLCGMVHIIWIEYYSVLLNHVSKTGK